jgi:uroporphyrinogen-III synthase
MRVLVLRPEPQAGRTAAALAGHGIEATVVPMLLIVPQPEVVSRILDPAQAPPGVLVFTSAHGVDAVRADPRLGEITGLVVHAVGPATAEAARAAGFPDVRQADGDGAALLAALRAALPPGAVVVHVAGRDRSVDIADALGADGWSARTVEAYHAEASEGLPPDVAAAVAAGRFDIAVVASRRTAEAFARAITAHGSALPLDRPALVAISAVAAEPLRGLLDHIVVADRPDGDALTEGVVALAAALTNNARNARPEAALNHRDEASEEPHAMAPDQRDRAGDAGRRKGRGRSTTIDLTATEVREAAAPGSEPVRPGTGSADDAVVSGSAGDPVTTAATAETPPPVIDDSATAVGASESLAAHSAGSATDPGSEPVPQTDAPRTDEPPRASGAYPVDEPLPRAAAAAPRAPDQRGSGLGSLAAAAIGGLIVLAGGAGLMAVGAFPGGGGTDPAATDAVRVLDERVSALGTRLDALPAPAPDLSQRLAAVETAVADRPAAGPDLTADIAALSSRLDALATAPAAQADLGPLTERIDALARDIDALRQEIAAAADVAPKITALDGTVGEVRQSVETIRGDLSGVTAEVAAVRTDLAAASDAGAARDKAIADAGARVDEIVARLDEGPKGGEIAALSLAVTSLASRVAAGEPFAADLALVRTEAADVEGLDGLVASAETGVPTIEVLAADFPADAILSAMAVPGDGALVDRLFAGAKSLVNYRETGADAVDPVAAGVTAIQSALAANDAAAAKAAADALPPGARAAGAAWFDALDRRVAADSAVAALTDRILTRLKAPAEGQ